MKLFLHSKNFDKHVNISTFWCIPTAIDPCDWVDKALNIEDSLSHQTIVLKSI